MTWFDRHPLDLAEQSEPAEALAAVKALDALTARDMAVLDVCLEHWVLALLTRPGLSARYDISSDCCNRLSGDSAIL